MRGRYSLPDLNVFSRISAKRVLIPQGSKHRRPGTIYRLWFPKSVFFIHYSSPRLRVQKLEVSVQGFDFQLRHLQVMIFQVVATIESLCAHSVTPVNLLAFCKALCNLGNALRNRPPGFVFDSGKA